MLNKRGKGNRSRPGVQTARRKTDNIPKGSKIKLPNSVEERQKINVSKGKINMKASMMKNDEIGTNESVS